MFSRLLTSGLIAGSAAGFFAALLQLYFVQPVLLHAELYETGALTHFGQEPSSASPELPGFDPLRDVLSILFTMLIYAAYSLMLVAVMFYSEEKGAELNARTGLLWGVAGFAAVHLAPAFSMPPEVPGVATVDIGVRQLWWFATVAATAFAIWLIVFAGNWWAWTLAVVLILAPHVIGAPEPTILTGPAPTEIGALFASRALGVGLIGWCLTGILAGWLWAQDKAMPD